MKLFFSKNDVYDSKYYLYQYNDDDFRLILQKYHKKKGFEETKEKLFSSDEESERCSLSRTKRNIRELCLCNDFEYFATLTINSKNADRFSLTQCQELLRKKLKKLKRINTNFAYLFITEKHKNGAFHFHGMIRGVHDFYKNENGYLSHKLFDEIGFNSFSRIKNYTKTCNYITKYITKDCVKNEAGTIYISSRGLKKALKYEIAPINIDFTFENDFVKIRDFKATELSQSELLNFINLKEI